MNGQHHQRSPAPSVQGPGAFPATVVLLVVDNPGDAGLVEEGLRSSDPLERFDLLVAETLAAGVALASAARPDVALLDLDLPDARGLESLHSMLRRAPSVPVVVLTGNGDEALGRRALQEGAQDYLVKGATGATELQRALRYAISRHAMTTALRESEARFHALFSDAPVGLRCLALDGTVIEANVSFAELTGHGVPELLGMPASRLAAKEDAARERQLLQRLAAGEQSACTYEMRVVRADGKTRHVQVSARLVCDPAGKPAYTSAVVSDVTERIHAQAEVLFQAGLLDAVAQAVTAWDADGRLTYWNRAAADWYGLRPTHRGRTGLAALGATLPAGAEEELVASATAGEVWSGEVRVARPGGPLDVWLTRTPVVGPDGTVEAFVDVGTDLAQQKLAQRAVEESEERLQSLIRGVSDVITLHDADGSIRYMSPSGNTVFGLDDGDLSTVDLTTRVHPEDLGGFEQAFAAWASGETTTVRYRVRHRHGDWVHCESAGANLVDNPAVAGIVVTTRDITERKKAMDELAYQAMHDGLTGLPNRTLFLDRLTQALGRRRRTRSALAVLFLDLDNFKFINDSYGHHAGDEVLLAVGQLLETAIRPGDTIARLGGDEFAVVCEDIADVGAAYSVADRLSGVLNGPFKVGGRVFHVTTSIGISYAGPDDQGLTAHDVLRDADAALYAAKDRGRARTEVFDDALRHRAVRRVDVEEALRDALAQDQLEVHYQPHVDLRTGAVTGFEALLRWSHPVLGSVGPDEFVPVAESTGLIRPIGQWVLEQVCAQVAAWRVTGFGAGMSVAVNLSALQLADDALVECVRELLHAHDLDPASICFEITEGVLMEEASSSSERLRRLKALGVQLAIDDFGTGYSSLAYLKRFPVDYLKIDRVFVSGLGRDPEDTVIVASVIGLASSLGLGVVAEGVETEEQLRELVALGCESAQGFLWSRAAPAPDAQTWIGAAVSLPGTQAAGVAAAAGDSAEPAGVDEIVSSLAHELRTPITVIRGFAETLGELMVEGRTDILQQALDAITRQTDGMESLICTLGDIRSLDSGSFVLDTVRAPLHVLVRSIVDDLRAVPGGERLELVAGADAFVCVDADRIRQVVSNLVTNALRHGPPDTPVVVCVDVVDGLATVGVVDEGPGIPAQRLGDLFRKFTRLDRTRGGLGLGLFLARSLARAHGGEVRYRRAATGGAEFTMTLPVAAELRPS